MPNKIRIYNSTYNEIFPIPEGKEEELIARAKKYKMNYEIISSNPAQQNNTPQAVPTKPMAQQSNSKAANNSNQVDLGKIDSDTLISNYNAGVEQAKQMRGQNKEELKREVYNSKREKDYQTNYMKVYPWSIHEMLIASLQILTPTSGIVTQ